MVQPWLALSTSTRPLEALMDAEAIEAIVHTVGGFEASAVWEAAVLVSSQYRQLAVS